MSKKKMIIVAIALVAVIATLVVLYFATRPKTQEGTKTFTVVVVHADGQSKTFQYTTEKAYLGEVLQAEGLIAGEQGEYGLFIKTVDGETIADDTYCWALYEGEQMAGQGIDTTPVKNGVTYKLAYVSADSLFGSEEQAETEPAAEGTTGEQAVHGGGSND